MAKRVLFLIGLLGTLLWGCGNYTFTGANLSPELKTVQIDVFPNNSNGGPASLSQLFTESLKDKFTNEANLSLVTRDGDLRFGGYISTYRFVARAPTEGETSALNRLTIGVQVRFTNRVNQEENWESGFSKFADYSSDQNLSAVEEQLIQEINEQLVDDIFTRALVKW